ncbi:MAG: hypothetical protein J6W48_00065, partial [Lachnospiraceae bacterium]|nr:hypothetical protein [Lachnospiraceae bacterium]
MGKFFNNRNKYKKESVDSELAAFEEEFVSLDDEYYEDEVSDETATLDYLPDDTASLDLVSDDTASLDYTGEIGFETEPIEFEAVSDLTAALDREAVDAAMEEYEEDEYYDEESDEPGDLEYEDSYGEYAAP